MVCNESVGRGGGVDATKTSLPPYNIWSAMNNGVASGGGATKTSLPPYNIWSAMNNGVASVEGGGVLLNI